MIIKKYFWKNYKIYGNDVFYFSTEISNVNNYPLVDSFEYKAYFVHSSKLATISLF